MLALKKDYKEGGFVEKRLFPRFPAHIQIEMTIDGESSFEGNHLIDIGLGGVSVETTSKLSINDTVGIGMPAGEPCFEGYGEVTWVKANEKSYEVGLRFVKMTGASIEALHKLLQQVKNKIL